LKQRLRSGKFRDHCQRCSPPDLVRKKNHRIRSTEITVVDGSDAHLRWPPGSCEINFLRGQRRLERRETKAAPFENAFKPARKTRAEPTLLVVENPAAEIALVYRSLSIHGFRAHAIFSG
jgi:hypothetical protein